MAVQPFVLMNISSWRCRLRVWTRNWSLSITPRYQHDQPLFVVWFIWDLLREPWLANKSSACFRLGSPLSTTIFGMFERLQRLTNPAVVKQEQQSLAIFTASSKEYQPRIVIMTVGSKPWLTIFSTGYLWRNESLLATRNPYHSLLS